MKFTYHGVEYSGFEHPYNTTALNERAVEIPVVMDFLGYKRLIGVDGRGLEVGNVLSHYGFGPYGRRRVVDLYEAGDPVDGVENVDVFSVRHRFDWIVSISTLEHVRNDDPWIPSGSADALDHLRRLLIPGGRMIVTVPGGHHPIFDEYLATGAGTTRCCTMVRDGDGWVQTDQLEFRPYGATTEWAESVWIGEW